MNRNSAIEKVFYGLFLALYLSVITITFYSDTMLPKIVSMTTIVMALLVLMVKPQMERFKTIAEFPGWIIAGLLLTYTFSIMVWLINIEEAMYIGTGTKRIAFYIVNVLVALSAVYLFGSKAVDYTLYSAFTMNSFFVLQGLAKYGISQSIQDILNAFKTGEQLGFMSVTEINNITYVYGFFILYYLFISDYSKKKKALHIAACAAFVILGFKRINMASIMLALGSSFIYYKLPQRFKKKFALLLCVIAAAASFVYIPLIRNGGFEYLMTRFNINTNTRIDLYNFVKDIYEFKPGFLGHGIDYVMRYLEYLKSIHVYYKGASLKYIHNDILVKYIEMGFVGFVGWLYAMCIFGFRWFNKHCGERAGAFYAMVTVNNFINISVGNTNHDYCIRLVIEIILISTVCKLLIEDKGNREPSPTV